MVAVKGLIELLRTIKKAETLVLLGVSAFIGSYGTGYWWRWRELNPRPQILCLRLYMLIQINCFNCLLPDWQGRHPAIP